MTQVNGNDLIQDAPVSLEVASKNIMSAASELGKPKEGESLAFKQEETRSQLAKYLIYGWAATILLVLALVLADKIAYYRTPDPEKANITANSDQTRHKSSNLKVSPKLDNIWQHIRLIYDRRY